MTNNHPGTVSVAAVPSPASWRREADIVVIGSGGAGMPAAIFAREAGASVILVEAEPDIGATPSSVAGTSRSARGHLGAESSGN
jgi:3-oxosteroid 1-dehydrogenase